MTPKLIALSGPLAGDSFTLDRDSTSIGREAGNDILLEADWVSRRHCRIDKVEEGFQIVDLDSHNGTNVNGVPIKERLLRGGDQVSLAGASFLFVDHEDESSGALTLELEDEPIPDRATVQLRAEDALYLQPERLETARVQSAEARTTLAAMLKLVRLMGTKDGEALPDKILDIFLEVVPAERGAVLLGRSLEDIEPLAMRKRAFAVSRTILSQVLEEKSAVVVGRIEDEAPTPKSLVASKVHSLIALPLTADGQLLGAIYLDSRDPKVELPADKLEPLMGLAGVAAVALDKARQLGRLRDENDRLQQEFELEHDMVGESPKLEEAERILARAAETDTTVLIEGESGTGKELAARALHFNSPRRHAPLIKVDCTGLNENLLASELFGHEKGAFTGAIQQKKGKLEIANHGTVFLDEIGELPLALQAQLLRVLQDREFERVGGTRPISVDIRLVAATNRDLAAEVKKGNFREDLFYRLNVVKVLLPPLRERPEDIELLARYFVSEFGKKVKRKVVGLSSEALEALKRYEWPGNIRELANTIERAVVLGSTELILPDDLPEMLVERARRGAAASGAAGYHEAVAEKKRELILDAVSRSGGSITQAAKLLGLHPNYLHRLIRNLDLRDELKNS
jgi:transcriptional regulator with GAF, ATPase, and Fis domain